MTAEHHQRGRAKQSEAALLHARYFERVCRPMARNYPGASPGARFSQSRRLGELQERCRDLRRDKCNEGQNVNLENLT